jgi:hypothetical protein
MHKKCFQEAPTKKPTGKRRSVLQEYMRLKSDLNVHWDQLARDRVKWRIVCEDSGIVKAGEIIDLLRNYQHLK